MSLHPEKLSKEVNQKFEAKTFYIYLFSSGAVWRSEDGTQFSDWQESVLSQRRNSGHQASTLTA